MHMTRSAEGPHENVLAELADVARRNMLHRMPFLSQMS